MSDDENGENGYLAGWDTLERLGAVHYPKIIGKTVLNIEILWAECIQIKLSDGDLLTIQNDERRGLEVSLRPHTTEKFKHLLERFPHLLMAIEALTELCAEDVDDEDFHKRNAHSNLYLSLFKEHESLLGDLRPAKEIERAISLLLDPDNESGKEQAYRVVLDLAEYLSESGT